MIPIRYIPHLIALITIFEGAQYISRAGAGGQYTLAYAIGIVLSGLFFAWRFARADSIWSRFVGGGLVLGLLLAGLLNSWIPIFLAIAFGFGLAGWADIQFKRTGKRMDLFGIGEDRKP